MSRAAKTLVKTTSKRKKRKNHHFGADFSTEWVNFVSRNEYDSLIPFILEVIELKKRFSAQSWPVAGPKRAKKWPKTRNIDFGAILGGKGPPFSPESCICQLA